MANDSSQIGYLQPFSDPLAEGEALQNTLHDWIVGLSNVRGDLVRPAIQPEGPNTPTAGTLWIAFSIEDEDSDSFPAMVHTPDPGKDQMRRNESFTLHLHIYDLGAGSPARAMAKLIRDNTSIRQNLDPLLDGAMVFVECLQPIPVPSLHKERWRYRLDMGIRLRRMVSRDYHILDIASAAGSVENNNGDLVDFDTENEDE